MTDSHPDPRQRRYRRRTDAPGEDAASNGVAAAVERYLQDALAELPGEYAERIENVSFVVRRQPTRSERINLGLRPGQDLYGLYQGRPLPVRGEGYNFAMPDLITIFWLALARDFPDDGRLRRQVKKTVFHEIAHYFGMTDEDLRGTSVH